MSVNRKLGLCLSLCFSLMGYGGAEKLENDLSPFRTIVLRAEVKTVYQTGSEKFVLHIRIPHGYTNSLSCSGRVPFALNGVEMQREVVVHEMLIFPDAAFGRTLSFPVPMQLRPGE